MSFDNILVITDDKVGNINPAVGLAEAITQKTGGTINRKTVKPRNWIKWIPKRFILFFISDPVRLSFLYYKENIFGSFSDQNFPDLIIGHGNASVIGCALFKRFSFLHNLGAFTVQILNPRINTNFFDCVVAPSHDRLQAENVITITGSLSRIRRDILRNAGSHVPLGIRELKKPIIAVLIGGTSKRMRLNKNDALKMAIDLKTFSVRNSISLAVSVSRRTGSNVIQTLKQVLIGERIYYWDGVGENPYYSMISCSEAVIVTSDSVNMISEAASAGKQVLIYPIPGRPGKLNFFYKAIKLRACVKDFSPVYKREKCPHFNETDRVAALLIKKFNRNRKNESVLH